MTHNSSEQRQHSAGDIDAEQRRIDALDGVEDAAVGRPEDVTASKERSHLYLERTNSVQGKIRDLRRLADAMRMARQDGWQQIDEACTQAEGDLVTLLRSIDATAVDRAARRFATELTGIADAMSGVETLLKFEGSEGRDVLMIERERKIDALKALSRSMDVQKAALQAEIEGLAQHTKESEGDDQIERNIAIIRGVQQGIAQTESEMALVGAEVAAFDLRIARIDIREAQQRGQGELADRILLILSEQYGDQLQRLDPELAKKAEAAVTNPQLPLFDRQLHRQSPGSALMTAVAETKDIQMRADIVDQLEAPGFMQLGTIVNAERFFRGHPVVSKQGEDMTELFHRLSFTRMRMPLGNDMNVALTEPAVRALGRIPEGGTLVLLREIEPANFTEKRTRNGTVESYVPVSADFQRSCVIQKQDVGFVDAGGVVHEIDGSAIDDDSDPRLAAAREQITLPQAFRVEPYRAAETLLDTNRKRYPHPLSTLYTSAGKTYPGIRIDDGARRILEQPVPTGMTLVLTRVPQAIILSGIEYRSVGRGSNEPYRRVLDCDILTADDLAYAAKDGDSLTVHRTEVSETSSVSDLKRQREESGRDVLRAVDQDESIRKTTGSASVIGASLSRVQRLLTDGAAGTKRQAFVDFARSEARPALELLRSPETRSNLNRARGQLLLLKKLNLGVALGGVEQEIDARMKALDDFAKLLDSRQAEEVFQTILDASKFDADTWAKWASTDLVKMLSAIVVASAAIVSICATFGNATPLWVIALSGAAGGTVGNELAAEGIHAYRNTFDEDVLSGRVRYSARSRIGAWAEGQEVIEPATGLPREMGFLVDVVNPYARELLTSFAITYATLGAGRWAAGKISMLAQRSEWVQSVTSRAAFTKFSGAFERIKTRFEAIADRSLANRIVMESLQEVGEEGAEAALQQGLNAIDSRLAIASGFALVTIQGLRLRPRVRGFTVDYPSNVAVTDVQAQLETQLKAQGYGVLVDGTVLNVTLPNGERLTVDFKPRTESILADIPADAVSVVGEGRAAAFADFIQHLELTLSDTLYVTLQDGKDAQGRSREQVIEHYVKEGYILDGNSEYFDGMLSFRRPYRFTPDNALALAECFKVWKHPIRTLDLLQKFGCDFHASDLTEQSGNFMLILQTPDLESFLETIDSINPVQKIYAVREFCEAARDASETGLLTPDVVEELKALEKALPGSVQAGSLRTALDVVRDRACMETLKLTNTAEPLYELHEVVEAGTSGVALDLLKVLPHPSGWHIKGLLEGYASRPAWDRFMKDPAFRAFVVRVTPIVGFIASDADLEAFGHLAEHEAEMDVLLQFAERFSVTDQLRSLWTSSQDRHRIASMCSDAGLMQALADPGFQAFIDELQNMCSYRFSFNRDLQRHSAASSHMVTDLWKNDALRTAMRSDDFRALLTLSAEPITPHALQYAVTLFDQHSDIREFSSRLAEFDWRGSIYQIAEVNYVMTDEQRSALFSPHALNVYTRLKETGAYTFDIGDLQTMESFALDATGLSAISTAQVLHGFGIDNFTVLRDRNLLASIGETGAIELFGDLDPQSRRFVNQHLSSILDAPPEKRRIYVQILRRLDHSQSQEIQKVKDGLARQIVSTDDPLRAYEAIESVFVRNNLPMPGKIFRVFQILYPPETFARYLSSQSSPALQKGTPRQREATVYRDLMSVNIASDNRSLKGFLEILVEGEESLRSMDSGSLEPDADRRRISHVLAKFETVFNQSLLARMEGEVAVHGHDDLADASLLERYARLREVAHARDGQSLSDRMAEMYLKPLGYETAGDVLTAMTGAKERANARGLQIAADLQNGNMPPLNPGDLLKGVNPDYIHSILQNGATAPELLGGHSKSDATPFDTDVSVVLENDFDANLEATIDKTVASGYGGFILVVRDRGQLERTDLSTDAFSEDKLELFQTGVLGEGHYGIRSGFGSTEIDYIVAQESVRSDQGQLNALFFEIAQNGWYIPVVDKITGALLFTPDQYAALRRTFQGIRRFDGGDFEYVERARGISDAVHDRYSGDLSRQSERLLEAHAETAAVSASIQEVIAEVLREEGVELKESYDTSLGGARFFDMGSTGRATNLPGDFDFDYTLKLDDSGDDAPFSRSARIAQKISERLKGDTRGSHDLKDGGQLLKMQGAVAPTGNVVDVDLSILPNSQVDYYVSHQAVEERLQWIRANKGEQAYVDTISGILLAKKLLKEGRAYKKVEHGGMGGIGVENWILSSGGNMLEAFRTFYESAHDSDGNVIPLEEFKQRYRILNPGVNFRDLEHDNYTAYLTEEGYASMLLTIKEYLAL